MLHVRPYRGAKPVDVSRGEIDRLAGTHFDPAVVRAFRQVLAEARHAA
jgi:HD-GYP domain-containing protein (c-di-GMP phosphodiesterase class II)